MPTPEPKQIIGRKFENEFVFCQQGDEYVSCEFIRCHVSYPQCDPVSGSRVVFYDCGFTECFIEQRAGNV